jgi:hypothetical protein
MDGKTDGRTDGETDRIVPMVVACRAIAEYGAKAAEPEAVGNLLKALFKAVEAYDFTLLTATRRSGDIA